MELQNPNKKSLREESENEGLVGQCSKIEVCGGNISLVVDFSDNNVIEEKNLLQSENGEFLDGNLVWGMINSKKWWPGQVVDFKADAKESFMVRFLGDNNNHIVSWFAPSKLKPFKESFKEVVNQSNDMGFFSAVEKAMTLLGNSLKLDMTCPCVSQTPTPNGKNRKVKSLILREFSVEKLEPKEFVTELKDIAKCVLNAAGILETTVLQSRLYAFNSFFGHKQIPMSQLQQTDVKKFFTAAKMKDDEFVGSPSVVAGSSRRKFRKEWFRKFVSEVDNVNARDHLVDTSPSDLVSKLKLLAVDYKCSEETENIGLLEWFFSRFRISMFHDENAYKTQLADMASLKDFKIATTEKKASKSKILGKSIDVSIADTEQKKASIRPVAAAATLVPDLNSGGNPAEFDQLQRPKEMMLNFQVAAAAAAPAQCSTYRSQGTEFVSNLTDLERKFTSADLLIPSSEKKKRGRKRKNTQVSSNGIPDLNGTAPPVQRRRRQKKDESSNGLTRGITILYLKFSSLLSMPSRDDLTSTFSAFGPLDSSETHVSEESSGAQVAFVSSGDAIEALKSLEKANPFGETLVSFRLQQKLITVQRNVVAASAQAPLRMPVISHVSPIPTPTSVDSMRQNLMMMTSMLEKSGDRLSRETKEKLKCEIAGLLEKVTCMPSSSSSGTFP